MAYKEKSPIPVVEGGTGSTSFGTTDGTVYYNGTNLVATATGTAGQLLTSNGAGVAPTFQTAAASSITITGDSGGGLTGNSFTFTGDTTGLTFAGAGTTETLGGTLVVGHGGTGATTLTGVLTGNGTSAFTASAVTQHDVLVGGVSNAITSVAPSATSGVPLISQGAAADPAFGTAVVAGGGTGATTFTANGVLLGNTTSAITATAAGTTGQVLTGVTGSAPTFQSPAASSISITGDSGGALTGASFTFTGGTTGFTFAGSGSTETLGGTLVVANGGTGDTSLTAYAVLCGGTTSTGAVQSIASVGTSGQVLTSNGAGALPTFQTTAGTGLSNATVTITSAQAKAIHATPITLLAAPGSGKFTLILGVTGQLNYGGTNAFTNAGTQALGIYYGTDSTGILTATALSSSQITSTSSQLMNTSSAASSASSNLLNKALVVSQPSATEIGGNAAGNNTITVNIWYLTVTP